MLTVWKEKDDPTEAIRLLEQSVQQLSRFRFRPIQGLFTAWLGEAHFLSGQIERARDLAIQALEITRDVKFWSGVGAAQRILGQIAQASGVIPEAETSLKEALETLTSIHARFEVGRTHLALARLTHIQGNREALTVHLKEAHDLFRTLRVSKYIERTEQLAGDLGNPFL